MNPNDLLSQINTPTTTFTPTIGNTGLTTSSGVNLSVGTTPQPGAATTSTPQPGGTGTGGTTGPDMNKINNLILAGTTSVNAAGQSGIESGKKDIAGYGIPVAQEQGQQNAIDLAREQIGTKQIATIRQLMDTIHQGLFGTGVNLGNTNALSSSARDAASRAYSRYGTTQTNAANNSAAEGNTAQDVQQQNLNLQIGATKTQLDQARDTAVSSISAQAAQALDGLKVQITYQGGDPNSVQADSIRQAIVQQAQNDLAKVDQNYQDMLNSTTPMSGDDIATAAQAMSNAGVVPSSGAPFSPGTGAPATPTAGGASAPSLIPLTVKPQSDQIPGA